MEQKGGSDTTFTPVGNLGYWVKATDTPAAMVTGRFGAKIAPYFFGLGRGVNKDARGVIQVKGSVGVSGVLRGRLTIYGTGAGAARRGHQCR